LCYLPGFRAKVPNNAQKFTPPPFFFKPIKIFHNIALEVKKEVRLIPLKRLNLCGEVGALQFLGYDTALASSWLPAFQA
jgi:hypothetical protein